MREVNLAGKQYQIQGDIIKRAISPWVAKVASGGTTYQDYSQASLEEYHDFRNGIGKKRGEGSDARLDWSEGIDFTIEGQAVLAPLVNTPTAPATATAPTITNADFELDSDWTEEVATCERSDAQKHGGQYSWYCHANGATAKAYQDLSGYIPGAEYTFTCWVRSYNAGVSNRITIDDGVGTTSSDATTATTFTQITVSRTLAINAIRLRLKLEGNTGAAGGDAGNGAWFDDAEISITSWGTLTPVKILDFQSHTYAIVSKAIFKWSGSTWDAKAYLASPIDAIVVTDATDEYFVVSTASGAIYSTDGSAWASLATVMGYLAFYDTKLWGITTTGGTLYYSAANDIDGAGGNFSPSGYFGTVYDLFEGKLLADGTPTLYFTCTQGVFTVDTANEKAYPQEVEYPPLTYSGHRGLYWNGSVWVATGYGILKITPSMATFIGPDLDDGLPYTYQGYIYDMETVNNWLVYCVNGGTTDKSSILKRNSSYGGNLQVYTTSAVNKPIACLHHSPSSLYTNGRLWFGEGTDIKYMMFPDTTSNTKQITTYQYVDDSGYGKFPILRKLAVIPKVALGVGAITKSCNANDYINVYYGVNGAAPTTAVGTGYFKSSPHPTLLTFGSGLGLEFYTIQFAIKLIRGTTNTNSPELESLLFYYLPRPATISAWTFNIVATDENAEAIIAEFEAIRDTKTLVAFYPSGDDSKTSYNVALSTMPLKYFVENRQTRRGTIQVTVEEVFNG